LVCNSFISLSEHLLGGWLTSQEKQSTEKIASLALLQNVIIIYLVLVLSEVSGKGFASSPCGGGSVVTSSTELS
jgi:hypothetical protein